jgi:glyoxylase-like metal-dependent hydrolase (beta-lactamase superfamily II)
MLDRRRLLAASAAGAASAIVGAPPSPVIAAAPPVGKQAPGFFRLKHGDFEITILHDGINSRKPEGLVKNAPLAEVEAALKDAFLPTDTIENSYTNVVVNTGSKLVMIDCGFADNGPPTTGRVAANLAAAGIDAKQIDTVVISHFHPDHINGVRMKDGAMTYPNAEIVVPAAEWAFWMDDARMNNAPEGMKPAFNVTRRVFGTMKDAKQYEAGKDVVPGIAAIAAPGHTPGHMAFVVASGNARLMIQSDTTGLPHLFARNPGWHSMFDMDAAQAEATRRRIYDMAVADRIPLIGYHYPFPAIAHVSKDGAGYRLHPMPFRSL